ncbi:MAG: hypothetical protein RQ985_00760 [Dehalococcoidia bacterium]|jgi:hypothetical protein|nr:hypothetical protein [Dehalococcoidia bacterium]
MKGELEELRRLAALARSSLELLEWRLEQLEARGGEGERAEELLFPLAVIGEAGGRSYRGLLHRDGAVEVDGRRYPSPSAAAVAILGYAQNGWRFWRYRDASGVMHPIDRLREAGLFPARRGRRRR